MQDVHEHPKLATIRALLAKAESTEFPAEREAIQERVNKLIMAWGIEEAEAYAKAEPEQRETPERQIYDLRAPYASEKQMLLSCVAYPLGCVTVRHKLGANMRVHVLGYPGDLKRVELLYTSLLVQRSLDLTAWEMSLSWLPEKRALMSARKRFLYAYACRVHTRMQEAYNRAEETISTGTSVALFDRRTEVELLHAELFPKAQNLPHRKNLLKGAAAAAGASAAEKADIGIDKLHGGDRSKALS